MTLIRIITLQMLIDNVRIYARHVKTSLNTRADALSRGRVDKFLSVSRCLDIEPDHYKTNVPEILTDIENGGLINTYIFFRSETDD